MNSNQRITICRSLRCEYCRRAPKPNEVEEMMKNFGDSLEPGDELALIWHCYDCCDKKPGADGAN